MKKFIFNEMQADFAGKIKNYVEISGDLAEKLDNKDHLSLSVDQLEKLHDLVDIYVSHVDSLTSKNLYNFKKQMETAINTYKGFINREFNVNEFVSLFSAIYDKATQFKYELKVFE